MHNRQCCYAKTSVHEMGGSAYLRGTQSTDPLEDKMNLIRSYKNWRRYHQTVRELSRLNARELNDLGISRADIEKVARSASY